jgi:uncharacterized repeat protein (TIGR01451 family)
MTACRASLIGIALLAAVASSTAGTFIVFGPQTFVRSTGEPVTVTGSFHVLNPADPFTLTVRNHGVTSAVILVNGQTIFAPGDFTGTNTADATLTRPVTLATGSNQIAIELGGEPGTSLTIEIVGVDDVAPRIIATPSPLPNASGWNNTNVSVTFSCSDVDSGIASCSESTTVGAEGANQVVSGTGRDNAGNTSTATLTLNVDKTPPAVTATPAPEANASGWNNTPVVVTFGASDALSGLAEGTLTAPITLSTEGTNQSATGEAADLAGNVGSSTTTGVNIDLGKPTIAVALSPASNVKGWNNGQVTAHFTCADTLSSIAACAPDHVIDTDGNNLTVTGSATDTAGNTESVTSAAFNIDSVVPTITAVASPAPNGAGWNNTDVTVTFNCTDDRSGIASCPAPVTVTGEGAEEVVTGSATDNADNTASTTVTLKVDKSPPVVAFTSSPPPSIVPGAAISFSVNATDNIGVASVAVSVNGTTIDTRTAGPFNFSVPVAADSEPGTNDVLAVTAIDLAGNSAVIQQTVSVNPSQLSLSVVPPASPTFQPAEGISGSVGGAIGGSTISVAGGASAVSKSLASGQTQFGVDVPLRANAENVLTVTATDSTGQKTSASDIRVIQLSLSSLVTAQVTAQRLTAPQVEALVANGTISLSDPANFNVSTFALSLNVAGRPAPVTVPIHVIKPIYELFAVGPAITLECGAPDSDIAETETGYSIPCDNKDTLPPLEKIKIVPFDLGFREDSPLARVPTISGVILLDGQIKTLKEFYKATLLLTNVSSTFTLTGLTAKITIPDSGLSPVAPASGAITMHDLGAGAQGSGDFTIRGDLIGTHTVIVNFGGQVTGGGLNAPVPFSGSASTGVEVRGPPSLNVTVSHPDEITAEVPYTLNVNIHNTSTLDALYASLELDLAGVADLIDPTTGVPLTGANVASLGNILAGETVSQSYIVVPRITGRITSCVGGAAINIKLSVVLSGTGAPPCAIGTLPSQVVSPSGQPTVTVLPAPNTTNVPLNATISALFSDAIQTQTLTLGENGTFRLADNTGVLVPGQLQFSPLTSGATAAVFTPNAALRGSTTYTIFISADIFDVHGARLASGHTASFTTAPPPPADTTAPQLTMQIKAPANPSAIPEGQLVSVLVDSSDDSGVVSRLDLQIDGELVDARGPVSSVTFLVDSSQLEPGSSHVLTAVATDPSGNSASASVNLSIVGDSNSPTVSLTAANRVLRGQSSPVSIQANDDVRVARVDVFLDGGADPIYSGSVAPYQFNINTMSLANGSHQLLALVTDGAGNTAQAAQAFSVVSITGLAISPAPVTITGIGGSEALIVTGTFSDGSATPIATGLTFLSSDTSRATVSAAGVVTAVAPGTLTIAAAVQMPTPLLATVAVDVMAGDPTTLTLISGDQQTAVVGQPVAAPFIVRVTDANGRPVPGVAVSFQALTGGGTLTAAETNTDGQGRASTTLTLGSAPGPNVVTATAGTLVGSPITFRARGISNEPPALTNPGHQSSTQGTAVSLQLTATDPNGDPLNYSVTGLPASLSIDSTSGLIAGALSVEAGAYPVTVTASNGLLSTSHTFTWTVTAPLTPFVDLATTISPLPSISSIGGSITYSITVANQGTAAATDVVTTDILPATLVFLSASGGCTRTGSTVSCSDGTLAPGQTVTHTITTVSYAAGQITNAVAVSSAQADVASINNSANAVITVVGAPPGAPSVVPTGAAEIFTPTSSSWTATGAMSTPRGGSTLTVLGDGTVLVLGGIDGSTSPPSAVATGELYNPTTGAWTATASLAAPRAFHTATLLPTGAVLISGGVDAARNPVATAEMYRGPPIQRSTPVITWPTPAAISYGTRLGDAQLNATANVPGTFRYSIAAGTLLWPGPHTVSVVFVPTDTIHFETITATVTLAVTP